MAQETFEAVVRGYKAQGGDPDLAAVIVEVEPQTVVPQAGCLLEVGAARRKADGLRLDRAVACITDRWLALEVGFDWVDSWVWVGVDAGGRATFERISPDVPY